jgi:hypothetical protein
MELLSDHKPTPGAWAEVLLFWVLMPFQIIFFEKFYTKQSCLHSKQSFLYKTSINTVKISPLA